MPPAGIILRAQTEADLPFVAELYAATRAEELRPVDWPEATKRAFLRSQFDAQWAHYRTHYFDAQFHIVERAGKPIGRLYVWRDKEDIRIVDIALISEAQSDGIGSALLREIMDEGGQAGKTVSIHVERFNRALRLYQRLGFVPVDEHGVYYLMKWTPPTTGI